MQCHNHDLATIFIVVVVIIKKAVTYIMSPVVREKKDQSEYFSIKRKQQIKEAYTLHASNSAVWQVPYGCAQPFQPYKWFWISLTMFK